MTSAGEEGSAGVVLAGGAAMVLVVAIGVGAVGQYLAAALAADAAADAAALAAAPVTFRAFGAEAGPEEEAARFAAANGARLVRCRCRVDRSWRTRTVTVTVERTVDLLVGGRRTVRATSRAEFEPAALLEP